jgi:hypothetical protein
MTTATFSVGDSYVKSLLRKAKLFRFFVIEHLIVFHGVFILRIQKESGPGDKPFPWKRL